MSSPSAIITGAASGIGLALTKALLLKGYHVVMADVHPPGDSLATSLGENALFIQTDTSGWESQLNLFQKGLSYILFHSPHDTIRHYLTPLSLLLENRHHALRQRRHNRHGPVLPPEPHHAIFHETPIETSATHHRRQPPRHNLQHPTLHLLLPHAPLPKPSSPNNGNITLTASQAALYTLPLDPIYGATKSALVALTRSLTPTLTPSNVTINAILPGLVPIAISSSLSRITSGDYCVYSWTYFGGIDNAYPFPETLALSEGTSPLLPITPVKYITPQSTIVQAATDLTNGTQTGRTVECSGTELFYRKQQEYPNEVARWVWEDAPAM